MIATRPSCKSTPAPNDQLIARLYDENVAGGTEQLIGRQAYRPLNPGEGFTKQVFQLHPQAWKVEAGHALKLELMVAAGMSPNKVLASATSSAADLLGLGDRGRIQEGLRADLVHLGGDLSVRGTWVGGDASVGAS